MASADHKGDPHRDGPHLSYTSTAEEHDPHYLIRTSTVSNHMDTTSTSKSPHEDDGGSHQPAPQDAAQPATHTLTAEPVASQRATAAFVVPTITEHDLLEFHSSHFPGLPPPKQFFVDPLTVAHLLPIEHARAVIPGYNPDDEYEEEDDGLGYYPDGVKRTLTDAQIEIFRHSECMQLERERQRKSVEDDKRQDSNPTSPPPAFDAHIALQAEHAAKQKQMQKQRQKEKKLQKRQRKKLQKQSQQRSQGDHADDGDTEVREEEVPYANRHKRRWEIYIEETDTRHGSITHRRLARELDDHDADDVTMDYGDDT